MIQLTPEQQQAYECIIQNFKTNPIVLVEGPSGAGKTTITKQVVNYFSKNRTSICLIAPTHVSKRILDNVINYQKLVPLPSFTVASLLGKMKQHSYIGAQAYSKAVNRKLLYQLFILDEVSMVSDVDLMFIIKYVKDNNKKLLIIGDSAQIPCPSAGYTTNEIIEKKDNFIFTDDSIVKVKLTTIMRQHHDSPIFALSCFVRNHLLDAFDIEESHYPHIVNTAEAYKKFMEMFGDHPFSCKIIAYTNQSVKMHNLEIRKLLKCEDTFVVHDLLMAYVSLGFPELILENSRDYIIQKVNSIDNHTISNYHQLSGQMVDLMIIDNKVKIPNLFFINTYDDSNYDFMNELIRRAEKVNELLSTKADYVNYNALKCQVFFIEDVYKYNNDIYTETDFKEKHALLFTKVDDVIKNKAVEESKLSIKINDIYNDIIYERLKDNKTISDSETLADRYKVIEKDVYYGYAMTSHRSQSKTIDCVIVDENDYDMVKDRWNYKYNKYESRIKEKNQLRYVAYTRAKKHLYIIH